MTVKVDFDTSKVTSELKAKIKAIQPKFDAQVLKDSNIYCPLDTSMLQKSANNSSELGSGLLVWNTPYAHAQYYGEKFDHSKSNNPNASAKWFEVAKAKRCKVWEKFINDEYSKNSK